MASMTTLCRTAGAPLVPCIAFRSLSSKLGTELFGPSADSLTHTGLWMAPCKKAGITSNSTSVCCCAVAQQMDRGKPGAWSRTREEFGRNKHFQYSSCAKGALVTIQQSIWNIFWSACSCTSMSAEIVISQVWWTWLRSRDAVNVVNWRCTCRLDHTCSIHMI